MKTIWKFPFLISRMAQEIVMPADAKILTAQIQGKTPCLWAEVESSNTLMESRYILVYGTGNEILEKQYVEMIYIATIQVFDEVYHVYEMRYI